MIRGWKKLTKKERKHLSEARCNNTFLFQKTIEEHDEWRAKDFEEHGKVRTEPCWDCRFIAHKLGMVPMQDAHVKEFVSTQG